MEKTIEKIKSCIKNCASGEICTLAGKDLRLQGVIVNEFSNQLITELNKEVSMFLWEQDHRIRKENKDSIDIFGQEDNACVIIELSKPRADMVAKKMLSRFSCYLEKKIIYIAICYPGTKKMNPNECIKYFKYGKDLLSKINIQSKLVGCIIKDYNDIHFY